MKLTRVKTALVAAAIMLTSVVAAPVQVQAAPGFPATNHAGTKAVNEDTYVWGAFPQGANINIWTEVNTNKGWQRSQTGKTDGNGGYKLPLTYAKAHPGTHEYRVGGKHKDGTTVYSAPFKLTRIGRPSVRTAGSRHVRVDSYVWGHVSGGAWMETWTEVKTNNGWQRSQVTKNDQNGHYKLPLSYGKNSAGSYTYRVVSRHPSGAVVRSDAFTFTRYGGSTSAKTAGSKPVNHTSYVWGSFQNGSNIQVWSEVQINGKWQTSQKGKANQHGYYQLPLTYGKSTPGTYKFRVAGKYPDGTVVRTSEVQLKRTGAPAASSNRQGTKYDWMRAAGIPESDWTYVDYIVTRESNWNPNLRNPYSGACGLPQAHPCSKLGSNWNDPVHSLKWQHKYVKERYGSYRAAYNFWLANRWY